MNKKKVLQMLITSLLLVVLLSIGSSVLAMTVKPLDDVQDGSRSTLKSDPAAHEEYPVKHDNGVKNYLPELFTLNYGRGYLPGGYTPVSFDDAIYEISSSSVDAWVTPAQKPAIMWLLDNMYFYGAYGLVPLQVNAGIDTSVIVPHSVYKIAQTYALLQFTNNDTTATWNSANLKVNGVAATAIEKEVAQKVYDYLVAGANAAKTKAYTSTAGNTPKPITYVSKSNDNLSIKLNNAWSAGIISSYLITDVNTGAEILGATLKNAAGTVTYGNNVKVGANQDFYLVLPAVCDALRVRVTFQISHPGTDEYSGILLPVYGGTTETALLTKTPVRNNYNLEAEFSFIRFDLFVNKIDYTSGQLITAPASFKMTLEADGTTLTKATVGGTASFTGVLASEDRMVIDIQEVAAPTGYVLDGTVRKLVLDFDVKGIPSINTALSSKEFRNMSATGEENVKGTVNVSVTDAKKYELELTKIDYTTRQPIKSPAKFTITGPGVPAGEKTTDANGIIHIDDLDGLEGELTYVITETTAPDGYVTDPTVRNLVVSRNRLSGELTVVTEKTHAELVDVSITNDGAGKYKINVKVTDAKKYELELTKIDYTTRKPIKSPAKFTITGPGVPAGEKTTDANGVIHLDNLDGLEGELTYVITETTAPDGYVTDPTVRNLVVSRNRLSGELTVVTAKTHTELVDVVITNDGAGKYKISAKVTDAKKYEMALTKKNVHTGKTITDSSATFTITGPGTSGSHTTTNGVISIDGLDGLEGELTYVITETVAPKGYVTDPTVRNLVVSRNRLSGELTVVTAKTNSELKVTITNDGAGKYKINVIVTDARKYEMEVVTLDKETKQKILKPTDFKITGPSISDEEHTTNAGAVLIKDLDAIEPNVATYELIYTVEQLTQPEYYFMFGYPAEDIGEMEVVIERNRVTGKLTLVKEKTHELLVDCVKITVDDEGVYRFTINLEMIRMKYDLALKTFVSSVTYKEKNVEFDSREVLPLKENGLLVKVDEENSTDFKYTGETEEPIQLRKTQEVTYTVRVFNEGNVAARVNEVVFDAPMFSEPNQKLIFNPENEVNVKNGWVLGDDGRIYSKKLEDVVIDPVTFDSKTFDVSEMFFEDLLIVFEVGQMPDDERILVVSAEVYDAVQEFEELFPNLKDEDSTVGNNKVGEDDQDTESAKVLIFKLDVSHYITQVLVNDGKKEQIIETGITDLDELGKVVKVEVKKNTLKQTEIKVVYNIMIENVGEIEGYALELLSNLPEGLEFIVEDEINVANGWEIVDGKLVNSKFASKLLLPEEKTTLQLAVKWVNSEENIGELMNMLEITKAENEWTERAQFTSGTPAVFLVAVVTGTTTTNYVGIFIVLVLLAGAVIAVKKVKFGKENN